MRTLVLNADFIPLHLVPLSTVTWQEAIILMYQKKATALEYHDKIVHSPSTTMQVPSVIVLKSYKYFKKFAKLNKYNIKLRDGFICQYCMKRYSVKSLTIDHVLPRSHGGKNTWTNQVAACKPCNHNKKNNRAIIPRKKPKKPTYYDLAKMQLQTDRSLNPEWQQYIPKSMLE